MSDGQRPKTAVISAAGIGGNAEIFLRTISNNSAQGRRPKNFRVFREWDRGICAGEVVSHDGMTRDVVLKIGVKDGFVIEDDYSSGGRKTIGYFPNDCRLSIGIDFELTVGHFRNLPHQIIADFVVNQIHKKKQVTRNRRFSRTKRRPRLRAD